MFASAPLYDYTPIAWLIGIVLAMAAAMFGAAHMLGPRRSGSAKGTPYESGALPVTSPRTRFDVRFYMVAMLFLLFDVEVALLWPWATIYADAPAEASPLAAAGGLATVVLDKGFLLGAVAVFVVILLVGYVYAWRKGAFRFS